MIPGIGVVGSATLSEFFITRCGSDFKEIPPEIREKIHQGGCSHFLLWRTRPLQEVWSPEVAKRRFLDYVKRNHKVLYDLDYITTKIPMYFPFLFENRDVALAVLNMAEKNSNKPLLAFRQSTALGNLFWCGWDEQDAINFPKDNTLALLSAIKALTPTTTADLFGSDLYQMHRVVSSLKSSGLFKNIDKTISIFDLISNHRKEHQEIAALTSPMLEVFTDNTRWFHCIRMLDARPDAIEDVFHNVHYPRDNLGLSRQRRLKIAVASAFCESQWPTDTMLQKLLKHENYLDAILEEMRIHECPDEATFGFIVNKTVQTAAKQQLQAIDATTKREGNPLPQEILGIVMTYLFSKDELDLADSDSVEAWVNETFVQEEPANITKYRLQPTPLNHCIALVQAALPHGLHFQNLMADWTPESITTCRDWTLIEFRHAGQSLPHFPVVAVRSAARRVFQCEIVHEGEHFSLSFEQEGGRAAVRIAVVPHLNSDAS